MTTQPEAERLAGYLDDCNRLDLTIPEAAAELRRLVSFNQQLMDEVARLNKAVSDEREACAKVAEQSDSCMNDPYENAAAREIAAAIRARGNT